MSKKKTRRTILVLRHQTRSIFVSYEDDEETWNVSQSISVRLFRQHFEKRIGTFDQVYVRGYFCVGRNTNSIKPEVLEMVARMRKGDRCA